MLKRSFALTLTVLAVAAVLLASSLARPVAADHTTNRIHDCRTIGQSGSYVLDRNLEATGDCLVITTSNVTIDLAGFTITGDRNGVGVRTLGSTPGFAITIRNGTVTNFAAGFFLFGRHHVVDGIRSIDNVSTGIILNGPMPAGNTVRNSIASGNGSYGILVRDTGNSVIGNVANGNGNVGISVLCPSTIVNNVATENQFGDIEVIPGPTVPLDPAAPVCTRWSNSPLP